MVPEDNLFSWNEVNLRNKYNYNTEYPKDISSGILLDINDKNTRN